jgi:hypothetical protein
LQNLSSTATQTFSPTPANVTAWIDGGVNQLLAYTCNQNNVVDNTQYAYYALVTDENGSGSQAGNEYLRVGVRTWDGGRPRKKRKARS